jgi:hypothetical protein
VIPASGLSGSTGQGWGKAAADLAAVRLFKGFGDSLAQGLAREAQAFPGS